MSEQIQKLAISVGTWPLTEPHDPALDEAGIPDGAAIFGLFDENYLKYAAPESIPGLTKVDSIGALSKDTYHVLSSLSGFSYVLVMSDNAREVDVLLSVHEELKIEDEIQVHFDKEQQETALEFISWLNENQLTPKRWFGPGYWRIPHEEYFIFGIHLYGFNSAADNDGWVFWFFSGDYSGESDDRLIQLVQENMGYCVKCSSDCEKPVDMTIFGKQYKNVCCQFPIRINNPDKETLEKVKELIIFWKEMAPRSESIHVR